MPETVGIPYKQYPPQGNFDAIVIGSGMGGLAAAAILAKHGSKRVLVLERHYTAGGYTHVFRRGDYEWDVGLHYIGQVHDPRSEARRLFDDITDAKLAWVRMPDVYDRIIIGDRAYDLVAGADRFRETLQGYFPREASAIDQYLDTVRACIRPSSLFFAEKVIPAPLARLIGPLMRWRFLRYAGKTTSTRHFSDHPHGEMYGLSHTPERFRMRLRAQTPVPGLFLTGQDLAMAGIVGALYGGVLAASAVLRRNVLKEILSR